MSREKRSAWSEGGVYDKIRRPDKRENDPEIRDRWYSRKAMSEGP